MPRSGQFVILNMEFFTSQDLHVAVSAFVGVMIAESVVKPVAVRAGRHLLGRLDAALGGVLPDWLSGNDKP